MGELKLDAQQDTKKPDPVKNEDTPKNVESNPDVVLKLDMHCSGCGKKLKKFVRSIGGVAAVKVDFDQNKLTVSGKVDPLKLREALEKKTNKKIELISPLPKKVEEKKSEEKLAPEKPKEAEEAPKPKPEAPPSTVVLRIKLHCDGCMHKIQKIIAKFKGVQKVTIDGAKDLVTVTGTMDMKEMQPYLVGKLRRQVDVIPPAKKDEKTSDDKKKEAAADGGKKDKVKEKGGGGKEKEKEKEEEVVKVETQRIVHQYHQPSYGYNQYSYVPAVLSSSNSMPYWYGGGSEYGQYSQGYGRPEERNVGYVVEHYQNGNQSHHAPSYEQYQYGNQNHHAPPEPSVFSDENPNGCYVM